MQQYRTQLWNADIHSEIAAGGFGICGYVVPLLRYQRTIRLATTYDDSLTTEVAGVAECTPPVIGGNPITSREGLEQEMTERRGAAVSGRGMRFHVTGPVAHTGFREPTWLLTGRDFIRAIHLGCDLMLTWIILDRLDNKRDTKCPCYLAQEHSLAHCLQGSESSTMMRSQDACSIRLKRKTCPLTGALTFVPKDVYLCF